LRKSENSIGVIDRALDDQHISPFYPKESDIFDSVSMKKSRIFLDPPKIPMHATEHSRKYISCLQQLDPLNVLAKDGCPLHIDDGYCGDRLAITTDATLN